MKPEDIKRRFPNASKSTLAANAEEHGPNARTKRVLKEHENNHRNSDADSIIKNTCEINLHDVDIEMRKNQHQYTCKTCGKSGTCSPSVGRKYCSTKCAYASKDRVTNRIRRDYGTSVCIECGIKFPLDAHSGKGKFCSRKCAHINTGRITLQTNRLVRLKTKESETACKTCGIKFKSWAAANRVYCSRKCTEADPDVQVRSVVIRRKNGKIENNYSRCPKGWIELGGKRIYCKSSWETKYARYLQWMKSIGQIVDWEYEPKTFWFEKIKRGVRSYLPDFKVTTKSGHEWHEVKGWMDKRSATKIKRMGKYYPSETLRIIDKKWFKASKKLESLVPLWKTPFLN